MSTGHVFVHSLSSCWRMDLCEKGIVFTIVTNVPLFLFSIDARWTRDVPWTNTKQKKYEARNNIARKFPISFDPYKFFFTTVIYNIFYENVESSTVYPKIRCLIYRKDSFVDEKIRTLHFRYHELERLRSFLRNLISTFRRDIRIFL